MNKQWAVVVERNSVEEVATFALGRTNTVIIATSPCPEEGCSDIFVRGDREYWETKEGAVIVLEESGEFHRNSPVFREVKDE